jgi:hypothetical protein
MPLRRARLIRMLLVGLLVAGMAAAATPAAAGASGPLSWSLHTTIDPGHQLVAISCEPGLEIIFCAAVDNAGSVLTSSNPAVGRAPGSGPTLTATPH